MRVVVKADKCIGHAVESACPVQFVVLLTGDLRKAGCAENNKDGQT
jgi:hypothetical protein